MGREMITFYNLPSFFHGGSGMSFLGWAESNFNLSLL